MGFTVIKTSEINKKTEEFKNQYEEIQNISDLNKRKIQLIKLFHTLNKEVARVHNGIDTIKMQIKNAPDHEKLLENLKSDMNSCEDYLHTIQMINTKISNDISKIGNKMTKESADEMKLEVYESWNDGLINNEEKDLLLKYIKESVIE